MNSEQKKLWLGIGIGVAVGGLAGGVIGYSVGSKKTKRRMDEEFKPRIERARRKAYDQATEEAKAFIDEYKAEMEANMIVVNTDDPASAQNALNDFINAHSSQNKANSSAETDISRTDPNETLEAVKTPFFGQIEAYSEVVKSDEKPAGKPTSAKYELTDKGFVRIRYGNEEFLYPQELFFDTDGYSLGETKIRANISDYEKNPITLKKIWLALEWGDYYPDPQNDELSDEDLHNMETDIDDQLGNEPEEKTIERQIYMDKVEQYINNPTACSKIVPRRRFEEDCYLSHIYVDYYAVDNIFVDNTDIDKELDAYTMFGVTDGKDLFKFKAEHPFDPEDDDNDPEIVHVENFAMNIIAEITLYNKSFESVKDGSAYLDGIST